MRPRLTLLLAALVTGCPVAHPPGPLGDAGPSDVASTSRDAPIASADVRPDAPHLDVPADAPHFDVPADAPRVDVPVDAAAAGGTIQCVDNGVLCERPAVCCMSVGGSACVGTAAECTGIAGLCDGPEDCGARERCIVRYTPVPGWGVVYGGTVCVGHDEMEPYGAYLCHVDADCPAGDRCCDVGPLTPRRCGLC